MKRSRTNLLGAALIVALASAGQLKAQYSIFNWNGGAGSGNGNWSAGNNWGGTAPSQIPGMTNQLFFTGTTQTTTTNDIVGLTNSITFNNDGFSVNLGSSGDAIYNGGGITNVTGSNFITGGLAVNGNSTGAGYYTVLAGTLNLNTTAVTNSVAGVGGIIHKVGPGTLILSGTNNAVTGTFFVDSATTAAGPVTTDDGVVIVKSSSALAKNGSIFISDSGVAKSTLQLDGSAANINLDQPTPTAYRFSFTQRNGFDAAPHIESLAGNNSICGPNPGGGKFQLGAGSSSGTNIIFQVDAGSTLTINGSNGTAVTGSKFYYVLRGAGNGIIAANMNNGASFYSAVGNFYKTNSGTWTITTNQFLTGNTIVAGGTLALSGNGSVAKCANISVLSGGILDVSTVTGGWVLNVGQTLQGAGVVTGAVSTVDGSFIQPGGLVIAGTLSFSNNLTLSAATTNTFDLGSATAPGGANDLINIAGNFNPNGASIVINPLATLTVPGTYRLINYSGTKTGTFGSLVINGRYLGHLDESIPGQVNFVVTGGTGLSGNLIWSGDNASGTWDVTTTANWNSDTEIFFQNDQVTFNDSSAVTTVNVSANVQPGSVTFNNTNVAYTLQGSGEIIGKTGLVKNGTNSLTLDITNTFTGNLTVNAGTLILGPNNGGGALSKGTNLISSGATLDINGLDAGNNLVAVSGTGVGGNGAIVSSTRNTSSGLHNITLNGDTLIDTTGSPIHFFAFVNAGGAADNYVKGQGYKLTVQGTNNLILDGLNYSVKPVQNPDFGDIEIRTGASLLAYYYTSLGRTGSNCIVDSGGSLTFFGTGTNAASKKLTLVDGSFWNNNNGSNFFNGPVALPSGSANVSVNSGSTLIVNGAISGAGGLTATNGTGTLALSGANTYTGPTVVYNSTLLANGSLASASVVTVNNSGTLGGVGTINGPVTINVGGTLSPGDTNNYDFGILTITTNLTIAGNLLFKVDISALHTNDYCVVGGLLTNASTGTLTLLDTNTSDMFTAGQSFKLFSKPVANGGALTILPALTLPLGWVNKLPVDGTVKIANIPPVLTAATDGSGNLNLTWDGAYTGYLLQVQTNSLSTGLGTNWVTVPGTDSGTSYSLPIDPANPSVFVRLAPPTP